MQEVPVHYFAFDLLYLDGRLLEALPCLERHKRLLALKLSGAFWQTPEHQVGDGAAMLEASRTAGLEGIIGQAPRQPL